MIPISLTWPILSNTSVCALQTTTGAANLIINGSLANGYPNPTVIFNGFSRVVTLTSVSDLSARSVTVTGFLNGSAQTETISGPNANTVSTTKLFDSVSSVSINGSISPNTISVGTGTTGQLRWINHNFLAAIGQVSVGVTVTGTINYSYQVTFQDVTQVASPIVFAPITALTAATTSQFSTSLLVANYSRLLINSSGNDGTLAFGFIQQGLLG